MEDVDPIFTTMKVKLLCEESFETKRKELEPAEKVFAEQRLYEEAIAIKGMLDNIPEDIDFMGNPEWVLTCDGKKISQTDEHPIGAFRIDETTKLELKKYPNEGERMGDGMIEYKKTIKRKIEEAERKSKEYSAKGDADNAERFERRQRYWELKESPTTSAQSTQSHPQEDLPPPHRPKRRPKNAIPLTIKIDENEIVFDYEEKEISVLVLKVLAEQHLEDERNQLQKDEKAAANERRYESAKELKAIVDEFPESPDFLGCPEWLLVYNGETLSGVDENHSVPVAKETGLRLTKFDFSDIDDRELIESKIQEAAMKRDMYSEVNQEEIAEKFHNRMMFWKRKIAVTLRIKVIAEEYQEDIVLEDLDDVTSVMLVKMMCEDFLAAEGKLENTDFLGSPAWVLHHNTEALVNADQRILKSLGVTEHSTFELKKLPFGGADYPQDQTEQMLFLEEMKKQTRERLKYFIENSEVDRAEDLAKKYQQRLEWWNEKYDDWEFSLLGEGNHENMEDAGADDSMSEDGDNEIDEEAKRVLAIRMKYDDTKPQLARAHSDFEAENDDELSFKKGDIIVLINEDTEDGEDWWEGFVDSDRQKNLGIFPKTFVDILPE